MVCVHKENQVKKSEKMTSASSWWSQDLLRAKWSGRKWLPASHPPHTPAPHSPSTKNFHNTLCKVCELSLDSCKISDDIEKSSLFDGFFFLFSQKKTTPVQTRPVHSLQDHVLIVSCIFPSWYRIRLVMGYSFACSGSLPHIFLLVLRCLSPFGFVDPIPNGGYDQRGSVWLMLLP
jgi:hypothetical protein